MEMVDHRERGLARGEIVGQVLNFVNDLNKKEKVAPKLPARREQRWRVPPPDIVKINSDGAFVQETMKGGWGFVARDHQGEAVIAGAGRIAADQTC